MLLITQIQIQILIKQKKIKVKIVSNNVNINKKSKQVQTEYPLIEHLEEIKKRLKYIILVLIVLFIAGYSQGERLVQIIQAPILAALPDNATMTMIDVTEMFFVEVKVSFIAALMVSTPFILYQLWLFIAPGLYMHERKYIYGFVFFASILFVLGASFAYFIVFPFGFKFFLGFAANPAYNVDATLSMASYVSFVVHLVLAFGIVFELPAIIFLLAKIGVSLFINCYFFYIFTLSAKYSGNIYTKLIKH